MLLVALVPAILAVPQLTPWLQADPLYYTASVAMDRAPFIQHGVPYMDPNNGFQTQALGYRAALDWLRGEVPWWNPYSGIGMPLAAEYQPAAFFPLTFLILLPRGMVLLQMVLQILAGLGTFALLRQLGLGRLAAATGGILYATNGTLAWLQHGPAGVVPSLPWILLGIERAAIAANEGRGTGWRILAIAMAASLLAGFPETAYINGLLALAWATLRGLQARRGARIAYAGRIALGGTVALLIASPQIVSFFLYLAESHIEGHADAFATMPLHTPSALPMLVAPYIFGPIFGYGHQWTPLFPWIGAMGGFVTAASIAAAVYGLVVRRSALALLLAGWIAAALGKTFSIEPFLTLWNLVPAIPLTPFFRYAPPSWTLALVILAAGAIDSLQRDGPRRGAWVATAIFSACGLAVAGAYATYLWGQMPPNTRGLPSWFLSASAWAVLSTVAVMVLVAASGRRRALRALAAFLAVEATLFCAIPILSNPRGSRIDTQAIEFLREGLGLRRFYTIGPIEPNYGAYFGIASLNHNYLPVPQLWVEHIQKRLDRKWTEVSVFNGDPKRNSREELRNNIAAFQEAAVKYVVTFPNESLEGVEGVKQVYADSRMRIFELPNPRPYFGDAAGRCRVQAIDRTSARVQCDEASSVVRRELFFPGWTATVNGKDGTIKLADSVFQSIDLPRGASEVRFAYAPPHIGWAWLAMWMGLAALLAPSLLLLRRKHQ